MPTVLYHDTPPSQQVTHQVLQMVVTYLSDLSMLAVPPSNPFSVKPYKSRVVLLCLILRRYFREAFYGSTDLSGMRKALQSRTMDRN